MSIAALSLSCRSGGGEKSAPVAVQFESDLLTVSGAEGRRGQEIEVGLASGKNDQLNVIIAQLDYDGTRMKLKECTIDPAVGEGTRPGKQLLFNEQKAGSVRTIVTGSVEPLPARAKIFGCRFTLAADAPAGATTVHLEADVSDTAFADHAFRDDVVVTVKE
jgi:hypothetical protein